jgi:hypothetical protein
MPLRLTHVNERRGVYSTACITNAAYSTACITNAAAPQTIGELELGLEIWENLVPTTSRLAYGHIYVAAAICMHLLVLYML